MASETRIGVRRAGVPTVAGLLVLSVACGGKGGDGNGGGDTGGGDAAEVGAEDTIDTTPPDAGDDTAAETGDDIADGDDDTGDAVAETGDDTDSSDGDAIGPEVGDVPDEETTTSPNAFRFAVLSDLRMDGTAIGEGNPNVNAAIDEINATGGIEFTLVLGDLAARLLNPWAFPEQPDPGPWEDGFDNALAALERLAAPWYVVPGDKDYSIESRGGEERVTDFADYAARSAFLHDALGTAWPAPDPWFHFEHGGVTFIGVSSMAGDRRFDSNGAMGSVGAAQMTAVTELLDAAPLSIVLQHHPPRLDIETEGSANWVETLTAHSTNLLALFHGHRFTFDNYDLDGIDAWSFGSAREPGHDWAIVEVDPDARSVRVVNRGDLPFEVHEELPEADCVPGSSTVDATGLYNTYHTVVFESFASDNAAINALLGELARVDGNSLPFVVRVGGPLDSDRIEATVVEAAYYHQWTPEMPPAGDHAVVAANTNGACVTAGWNYEEPCLSIVGPLHYDVISSFALTTSAGFCGIRAEIDANMDIEAEVGLDSDGNLSFSRAQAQTTVQKGDIMAALRQFLVDSYCAGMCGADSYAVFGENCDFIVNGHQAACDGGTMTYEEVPSRCDVLLGSTPTRALVDLLDLLRVPEATFMAPGWGHRAVFTDDVSMDWAIANDIFDITAACD